MFSPPELYDVVTLPFFPPDLCVHLMYAHSVEESKNLRKDFYELFFKDFEEIFLTILTWPCCMSLLARSPSPAPGTCDGPTYTYLAW